jgi:hypothetical protein
MATFKIKKLHICRVIRQEDFLPGAILVGSYLLAVILLDTVKVAYPPCII